MTPQELRQRRAGIIGVYSVDPETYDNNLSEILDELESLDAKYTAAQSMPYYAFVNQAESLWTLVKSCEGQPAALHSAIDALMSHLMHYAGKLPGKGKES